MTKEIAGLSPPAKTVPFNHGKFQESQTGKFTKMESTLGQLRIGKWGKNDKSDCPKKLPELVINRVWKGGGGGGGLIPICHSIFIRILHPTFLSYRYPTSCAQFRRIPLPRSSQIPNLTPFSSEIPDPENTLPDPELRILK